MLRSNPWSVTTIPIQFGFLFLSPNPPPPIGRVLSYADVRCIDGIIAFLRPDWDVQVRPLVYRLNVRPLEFATPTE